MSRRRTGDISATARRMLDTFLDELERWRPRVSLSTVPREQSWMRHVEESRRLLAAVAPRPGATVVDLGAGAGVPGVVIAVLRPDLDVTLVEADRRKAGFLIHACGMIGLDRVKVDARRAELLARDRGCRERWDLAVSRAMAPPARLCELALPLVRVGGSVGALVGDATAAVAACAGLAADLGAGDLEALPPDILLLRKERPTAAVFPRRAAARTRVSRRDGEQSPPPPPGARPMARARSR